MQEMKLKLIFNCWVDFDFLKLMLTFMVDSDLQLAMMQLPLSVLVKKMKVLHMPR